MALTAVWACADRAADRAAEQARAEADAAVAREKRAALTDGVVSTQD